MDKTLDKLRQHQSATPSRWREEAEKRRSNKEWLRYSQYIAMRMLDKMEADGITQKQLAERIMASYDAKEIDACYMIYHHAQSTAHQVLRYEQFLPLPQPQEATREENNYIVEPSSEVIFSRLLPRVINLTLFAALLDSLASEHAARVVAMQVATDNADELLRSLQLQYNKSRQSAITAELLDIVGGSMQ